MEECKLTQSNDMAFTYMSYIDMLKLLSRNKYRISDYYDWTEYNRCVILRHDVDTDLQRALQLARVEADNGIKSTYFILLTSNFYNPFSKKNKTVIDEIIKLGHTIGLHFDEMAYPGDIGNVEKTIKNIKRESVIISEFLGNKVDCFSYHRPSKTILDSDIKIDGLINAYGNVFFKKFKYLSDSRMLWREPVLDIINACEYQKLHILTHPFWYHKTELTMQETIIEFIKNARIERFESFNENFTNLGEVVSKTEI